MKKSNNIIILIDDGKGPVFDNIQKLFCDKNIQQPWSRRKIPNLTKCIYDKPTANITFNGYGAFPSPLMFE